MSVCRSSMGQTKPKSKTEMRKVVLFKKLFCSFVCLSVLLFFFSCIFVSVFAFLFLCMVSRYFWSKHLVYACVYSQLLGMCTNCVHLTELHSSPKMEAQKPLWGEFYFWVKPKQNFGDVNALKTTVSCFPNNRTFS